MQYENKSLYPVKYICSCHLVWLTTTLQWLATKASMIENVTRKSRLGNHSKSLKFNLAEKECTYFMSLQHTRKENKQLNHFLGFEPFAKVKILYKMVYSQKLV